MTKIKEIMSFEEIKKRLAPIFKDEGLKLVLLFGSAILGKVHKQSDIDIAFLFNRPVDILSLTNRIIRLLHADNIDIVDLSRASPLLKFSVVKNGKLLYERLPGMFNEFYSLAFRMYVDTKKLRDAQEIAIKHFLKARGQL
jgi:predicted nucleotidyltransferase